MKATNTQYVKPMRSIATISLLAIIAAACGGGQATGELAQLQQQRDSLKAVSAEVHDRLIEVKEQIASLDTSVTQRLMTVTALQLQPTLFEHFFKVQGVVEASENAQIFPEAAGRITSIRVKEGQKVNKGQLLLTIDSKVVANQIDEVEARLSLAETVFKRQEDLWSKKIGSEIQYLEAKNNYESLQQNLETLQAQLAMYNVSAPFSGVIDEILPKTGEMANPAMPLLRLISMDGAYMKADVTEGHLAQISEGDEVEVRFPSLNAASMEKISRIGSYINPNNRSFKIRLDLENSELNLKPNLMGELKIRDYYNDSIAVVPSSLIQMTQSGEEFVYTIEMKSGEAMAQKTMIKTGMSYEGMTEVLSGLVGNEKLVNKGARSIKQGDQIAVSE